MFALLDHAQKDVKLHREMLHIDRVIGNAVHSHAHHVGVVDGFVNNDFCLFNEGFMIYGLYSGFLLSQE